MAFSNLAIGSLFWRDYGVSRRDRHGGKVDLDAAGAPTVDARYVDMMDILAADIVVRQYGVDMRKLAN